MKEQVKNLIKIASEIKDDLTKWERNGSLTMVNREAHYQALASVKDHVLAWVMNVVKDMEVDVPKEVSVGTDRTLFIRKLMDDMYSGKVSTKLEILHQFDRITIPQLAGQLQSLLQLYNPDTLPDTDNEQPNEHIIRTLKPLAEQAEGGMVSQLISILSGGAPQPKEDTSSEQDLEIKKIIEEAKRIEESAKAAAANPDPKQHIEDLKNQVQDMLARVEAVISRVTPTRESEDHLKATLHDFQQKHDRLVDRTEQELNIINNKLDEAVKKLSSVKQKEIIIRIQ